MSFKEKRTDELEEYGNEKCDNYTEAKPLNHITETINKDYNISQNTEKL
jgi:hypothetical protein